MAEQQFRIADIEILKSPTSEKTVGIFRYDHSGSSRKGTTIIVLAEIFSNLYAYERFLEIVHSTVEQTRSLVAGVEQDPLARFEKIIQHVNEAVGSFLDNEPTPLAWNRINLFIIELSPEHICFTGRGKLMNIFLQKQEDGNFRTFDLFGSLEQATDVDPHKPFTSVICGDMHIGDILMAGTLNLDRLRGELDLKQRLMSLPPVSAALEMRQDLERAGIPDDFLAVIVSCHPAEKLTPKTPAISPPDNTPKSTASIQKLRQTEHEAHSHLSATIKPTGTEEIPVLKELLDKLVKTSTSFFQRHFKKNHLKDVAALTSLRGLNAGHGSMFTRKRKTTIVLIGAALLAVLIGSLLWKRHTRLAAEAAAWQATFDQISDQRNRGESDLVYGNDTRAKKFIETAESLLSRLDTETPERQEKVEAAKKDLTSLRERLRKIIVTENPTELLSLQGVPDGSLAAPVLTQDAAYVANNADKTIIKTDIGTKTQKKISLPETAEMIIAGSLGKQSVIFTTASGKLYGIDLKTDTITNLSNEPRASSTTDVILYAGRAYFLDGPGGQVWRGSSAGSGFGSQQAYIKASTVPLNGAVGLAIDSNVYILKNDGTVARFLSGGQEGFNLTAIDPPLRAASGIWTNADTNRIAIADPADKRIAIFNKDGSFKAQITSPQFSGPRDLDGDDANKRLIVIDGTRLLMIPLP